MADFTLDVLIPHLFPIPNRRQQTLSRSLPAPGRLIVGFVSSFDIRISIPVPWAGKAIEGGSLKKRLTAAA